MMKAVLLLAVLGMSLGMAQQSLEDQIKEQCSKAQVVAELWHGFTGGAPKAALENVALEFNRAREGRSCVRPVPQGSYRDLSTKVRAGFASGQVPAMAQAFENNMALYLEANALLPLASVGVQTTNFNLTFANANRFNGVLYGVPFSRSIQLFYVNRDLLKKYNARIPTSITEFVATAKKIAEGEKQGVYWFVPDASTYAYWFFTNGGNYVQNGKIVLNSAIGVQTLEFLVQATKDGWARAITSGFINAQFGSGTFGFATDTSAGYSFYRSAARFDLAVAPLPGRTANQPGFGLIQGPNIVIFRQAPEAQRRLAGEFLSFAMSARVQAVFSAATNYVPANTAALNEAAAQRQVQQDPNYRALLTQSRYAKFEPAIPEWEQIRFDILGAAVRKAVVGQATPKAALDEAQKAVEDLLEGRTR